MSRTAGAHTRPVWQAIAPAIAVMASLAWSFDAHAASPFESLAGSWSGGGRVTFEGGQSERLRCNAHYRSSGGGSRLGLSIRCASPSNAFDLRGDLAYRGGRVTGSWSEQSLGASGDARGQASSHRVVLRFSGTVSGSMSVALTGRSQTVTIASHGTTLRAINVSLRRR